MSLVNGLDAGCKVAFITGGSTGIGAATVKKFVQERVKVGILDIHPAADVALKAFSSEDVLFIKGDVSNVADIQNAIDLTAKKFGRLDAVFANAGIYHSKPLPEITEQDFDNIVNVNQRGAFFTVQKGIAKMKEYGRGGSVIIMASDQCFVGKPNAFLYGMTKGAIGQLTKSVALACALDNISVNAVCPATIVTPLAEKAIKAYSQRSGKDEKAIWDEEAKNHPVGRCGRAEEVADVVYFLAAKSPKFMTGTLIPIDGGFTVK